MGGENTMKYGIYLNDNRELRMLGLKLINDVIFSRDTQGEFNVKRLFSEFVGFIDEGDVIGKIKSEVEK